MLVSARGFEFDVFEGGPEDGMPIVLLHGFPQHSGQWEAIVPALHEAGLRTIAINQRGYSPGARPVEPAAYALSECVADVVSIMDALGHSSFHLVGHDWGAAVAWLLASTAPERVRTLTAISVPHGQALSKAMRDPESGQRSRSSYMFVFADLEKAVPLLLEDDAIRLRALYLGSGMTEEQVERYVAPMREPAALRAALTWYTAAIQRLSPQPGPVAVPTTLLWSNGDVALGRTGAEATKEFVTGDYRLIELDGISHWIPDQAPQATIDAILDRVRSVA
ncbi:epoxide hydrolase [Rhizocola hellebori]|uniref:Epoxide hydrolase n=1 Tax=Rhizocola hellebori TaxID=1392758 RepID=A0A8J3QIU3_9ACTN|nr:alpha/beta hydrolase [Rhizocola hellebori]GIH10432.1 epoxide hydrolase [Rhizocola hellebori]